ncbi:MAG: DedA family protein [Acidimicrobiia bacterium]|nr:DedA family protein [Acidimicrobiia bacterium]MBV9040802.1 DedA family protein [Acidimicrobiia bacterium]
MNFLDPHHLINTYGTLGILAIIFAESGLFFGFFLPGDSLLVTAGILASTHKHSDVHLNLAALLIGIPIAAILGDQVGYWFGRRVGPSLFRRPESRFFKPEYLNRAHEYLEHRGARMIILARFIPAVRTFTPIAAGAGKMRYSLYLPFDIAGGLLWGVGVTLAGYTLGSSVKNIDRYLLPVIAVVVIVSLIPVALELRRSRKAPRPG